MIKKHKSTFRDRVKELLKIYRNQVQSILASNSQKITAFTLSKQREDRKVRLAVLTLTQCRMYSEYRKEKESGWFKSNLSKKSCRMHGYRETFLD